jgi:hypothetical protein
LTTLIILGSKYKISDLFSLNLGITTKCGNQF